MPVRDVYCLYSLLDRVAATAAWRRENRHDGLKYQRMTLSAKLRSHYHRTAHSMPSGSGLMSLEPRTSRPASTTA